MSYKYTQTVSKLITDNYVCCCYNRCNCAIAAHVSFQYVPPHLMCSYSTHLVAFVCYFGTPVFIYYSDICMYTVKVNTLRSAPK